MSSQVSVAAGGDKVSLERFLGSEGDRVEQKIDLGGLFADLAEEGCDLGITGNVTGLKEGVGTKLGDELLDILLEALTLIVEEEGGSGLLPSLGNVPCNAAFVGDAENDADFTCEGSVTHPTSKPVSGPSCHAKSSWEGAR